MRRRLSASAQRDIAETLDWSDAGFGPDARQRYERLIERGLLTITAPRDPVGTRRFEARPGVALFHLRHCRGSGGLIVRNPRHLLVYRRPEADLVFVLRLLHDAMDIGARIDEAV
ncbi:hypothetical protein IP88_10435 [alpha proteobacterium AAP81b]|nr:hypothetical protein IP88_10435 [alpha proteobacterium AAP81b]